jgi:hypothetical protein
MRLPLLPIAVLAAFPAFAQNDEAYTKKIREFTTEPFFLTELVDHLPASDTVPNPAQVLGYVIGTPNKLTYSADCARYLRDLAAASPRVRVISMGKSEEGREMVVAVISSEANLNRLDRLKAITARLGDTRGLGEGDADQLISEGVPIYWATGAMHSPEAGSPEMLMELAYRLAVEETPFIRAIRENSVVMLTPVLETDGRDRYVDTYYWRKQNPKKPPIPLVYWGHYVAHDNNRDGMALSLALSKNLMKTWLDFHPQVLHDLHESVPYLYISTGTGPYNAWLDPITIDEWHLMAYNEVGEMTRRGVPGVWTHGFYDGWAPNYAFYAANGHNAIGRFYETFGGSGADTGIRSAGDVSRDWFRPNPPFPRVRWSIRNNINLQQSALLLGLNFVATNKERFLRNYYLKSKRSVAKARTEGPTAYVLPGNEMNIGQQTALIDTLRRQGIEVHRLTRTIKTADGEFPALSFVVRMDQPYSRMADMLLDKQYYNPKDPNPYDDTGWTLGPLFNVSTYRCKDVAILSAPMSLVDSQIQASPTAVSSATKALVVPGAADMSLAQLRFKFPNASISVAAEAFSVGKLKFGAGAAIVTNQIEEISRAMPALGIAAIPIEAIPTVAARKLLAPRIAIVHSWLNTQDDGWFRLAFDGLGIPYKYVSVHEIRDVDDLSAKYDVILLPPGMGSAQSIVNGISKEGDPIPWKPMDGFPNLGGPDVSDNIRGGMELRGVLHLQQFVEAGGLLITVGDSCSLPVDYGLAPGVSITAPQALNAPGGVYKTNFELGSSPIRSGYGESLGVYFSEGPLLSIGGGRGFGGALGGGSSGRPSGRGDANDPDVVQGRAPYSPTKQDGDSEEFSGFQRAGAPRAKVILRFADEKELLISGMIAGGSELAGKAAIIDCAAGKGHIVLFAINPMWRMQTHGSYMLLFNAAMNCKSLSEK